MNRFAILLLIQTIVIYVQCQRPGRYDIDKVSGQAIDQLSQTFEANNVSTDFVNVIRDLQPENIIKNYAMRELNLTSREKIVNDTECSNQLSIFLEGVTAFQPWALKMIDASSKIPSGLLIGNMKDLGVFDECLSVEVIRNKEVIRGRHCMYSLSVKAPNTTLSLHSTMSICLPAACDSEHVVQIMQNAIDTTSDYHDFNIRAASGICSSIESAAFELGDIIAISILTVFVGFLVICTICDVCTRIPKPHQLENTLWRKLSLYTSAKRVLDTKIPRGTLPAVQGIRFFSMCWVILGHEYAVVQMGAVMNMADVGEWMSSWRALYILIAPFAVDTFFVLSGFLVSYLFMKEMANGRNFNIIAYYIHRYMRLTPALGALLLLTIYVFPRFGSGALWESSMTTQKNMCTKNWWPMMLYVHNYVNTDYMWCLTHTWYLAVDMQLFWISPLILYPIAKKPKLGYIIGAALFIASVITPAVIAAEGEYSGALFAKSLNLQKVMHTLTNFYVTTHTRIGPWIMGVILGCILFKKRIPPSRKFIYVGWIATIVAFLFAFFTYRTFQAADYKWSAPFEVFYAAFSRHIWSFGICWIIYASVLGYGGILTQFLSSPIFMPFGRISYSVYLVHFIIQTMKMASIRIPVYFSDLGELYSFFGDFVLCTLGGFIFSLLFESPFMVLEKIVVGRRKMADTPSRAVDADTSVGVENCGYENGTTMQGKEV